MMILSLRTDGPYSHWQTFRKGDIAVSLAGSGVDRSALPDVTPEAPERLADMASMRLKTQTAFHGGLSCTGDTLIAWADHIRSFPIYYACRDGKLYIGNDARAVRDAARLTETDPDSLIEFAMAGYATGPHTLYKDLKVIQPGELLVWREGMEAPLLHRWFRYVPDPDESASWEENRARLGDILDVITKRVIDRAAGRPIWIPLSAGLDSRIILCKLHEHGYKNLQTFTYGPRFNFEAKYAKRIARTLCVPWQFIGLSMRDCRRAFETDRRRAYWGYADGLKVAPSMREFTALTWLKESGKVTDDTILINGQTGDYLSGGHVFPAISTAVSASESLLFEQISAKHYDLWKTMKTADSAAAVQTRIRELISPSKTEIAPDYWAFKGEEWEYDGRQVCLVVSGQRSYEFFGYGWELPLWERALVEFFAAVPLKQKIGQALYKDYLRNYNYKGLFPAREPEIWRWPLPMLWVLGAAQVAGMAGPQRKRDFYTLMRYFGHYSNQYSFFPFPLYASLYRETRNIFSLYVRQWLIENSFPVTPDIATRLSLKDHCHVD